MPISKKMAEAASKSSLVRKMFEEGAQMKAEFGVENVFDFSIGNPDVPPPSAFLEILSRVAAENKPGSHGYMPNHGWPEVRNKVATHLNKEQGAGLKNKFTRDQVLMTVGAAGALNAALKAILDPGDEVIVPKPCFMEYGFYADNHGAKLVLAESNSDFSLNLSAIADKITQATRVVLLNSPHNPTGVIYSAEELAALGRVLTEASARFGRPIMLLSDEPYRKLAYDDVKVPSVFSAYPFSVIGTSFSKDLSLPGERIGYAALNPDMPDGGKLFGAMGTTNRILGFVNAPSLMQLVVAELLDTVVDVNLYKRRRDLFVAGLQKAGYELNVPKGAFYLFPKSPIADDLAFTEALKKEKILVVPGSGFAQPGYFRICYCVSEDRIVKSLDGFARAIAAVRQ